MEMITSSSQSMEVKNQLKQVNADINILNQKLNLLLNTTSTIYTTDTLLCRFGISPLEDSLSISNNPSLGLAQQQLEASGLETKVEKSKMLPDFEIGYFSQTMKGTQEINGVQRSFSLGDRFNGIQANISIPLWFSPYTSKIKAAKIKQQVAQINVENYSKSLIGNYNSLMEEYSKYNNSLDYYEKQAIPEADLIIDQATKSYQTGSLDYFDYIQSLSRALNIKLNYLDALNNYNQTIISIDFIKGKIF